jgi:hypothetical protein
MREAGARGKEGGRGKEKTHTQEVEQGFSRRKNENLAADRAAKAAKTNRQYVSNLKKLRKEAAEVGIKLRDMR